ncbi:MAG: M28 family peptidase [Thermoanaerobaculia bacterium]
MSTMNYRASTTPTHWLLAVLVLASFLFAPASRAQSLDEVLDQVRPDEMWRLTEVFSELDRTSSTEGERLAADYLEQQLEALGVPHDRYEIDSYLSIPISASLAVTAPESLDVPALVPAFSTSTEPGGLAGELVYVGPTDPKIVTTRDEDFENVDLEGRIALLRGYPSPPLIYQAERAGAVGAVCIAPSPRLVNMIVSSVWGHPTREDAKRLPTIPIVSITETDGRRLEDLARQGQVQIQLEAKTDTGWKKIPLVMVEIPGAVEPEKFVLIANHIDSWHEGVTDSATGNASLLEVARVLNENRKGLRRSVRVAWWPGHSTGRYSGSTWYADNFYEDLYQNAVGYMAIDSPGVRSATALEPEGMWELKGFLESVMRERTEFRGEINRSYRYNDEAMWGIGVPSLTVYPAIPLDSPDRAKDAGGSAYGYWWHTTEDSLDKADRDLLLRDTKVFLAMLWPLATQEVLPFEFGPVVAQMEAQIGEYAEVAGESWDYDWILESIEGFSVATQQLKARRAAAQGDAAAAFNEDAMAVSRAINPVLFTIAGPFHHDPARQFPLFPGLSASAELAELDPASEKAGFIQTELLRETNRIQRALARATCIASRGANRAPCP